MKSVQYGDRVAYLRDDGIFFGRVKEITTIEGKNGKSETVSIERVNTEGDTVVDRVNRDADKNEFVILNPTYPSLSRSDLADWISGLSIFENAIKPDTIKPDTAEIVITPTVPEPPIPF